MARHHRPSSLRSPRGLALLWTLSWCCALVLRHNGGGVAAQTSSGGDDAATGGNDDGSANTDCDTSSSEMIGDALCDFELNVAACGFDGGDCCECTCIDTDEQACGEGGAGYFCLDPDASQDCGPTGSPTPAPLSPETSSSSSSESSTTYPGCGGYLPHIADGFCDEDLNNADCGFDGGDCCACTCGAGASTDLDSPEHPCGYHGDGFDCRDPNVPADCGSTPSPAASFGYPDCTGYLYNWQNSYCNSDLNNAACGYDGGDCCRCTCREYSSWSTTCGYYGFDCMDPEAPSKCSTDSPTPSPAAETDHPQCAGTITGITNGYCEDANNNEACDWDGGDCCYCTCEPTSSYGTCVYFDCLEPSVTDICPPAPTPSPSLSPYPECLGIVSYIGDGDCDSYNNNEECGWDGGDCCPCTCEDSSSPYTLCGSIFDCLDPTVSTDCIWTSGQYSSGFTNDDTSSAYCPSSGDGKCDTSYNTEECDWDGGDCCECDCQSISYWCGYYGYQCLDPASTCNSATASTYDDDNTDRGFGDSSAATIPVNQQEAWAGDTSESSLSSVVLSGIIAASAGCFLLLGIGLCTACGLARRSCFEDKKDGTTPGETARAYSIKSRERPVRPLSVPLAASASAIPPKDADETDVKRSRASLQNPEQGVYPVVGESKRAEEVDPAYFTGAHGEKGVGEVTRQGQNDSDADGGLSDDAGAASVGILAGDQGGGDVPEFGEAVAGADAAHAADDEVGADDGGAGDGVAGPGASGKEEENTATSVQQIGGDIQPAEGVVAAGDSAEEVKPPVGDEPAGNDGNIARPVADGSSPG